MFLQCQRTRWSNFGRQFSFGRTIGLYPVNAQLDAKAEIDGNGIRGSYSIIVPANDASGYQIVVTTTVTVPHGQK